MSWNYRLVRIKYPKITEYSEDELLEIKEIYYDESGNINGYGDAPIPYGETIDDVKECLDLMYGALAKPILEVEDILK